MNAEAYPKPLTDNVVRAADVIVTMGCGDTCPTYPGKRYPDWDVADPGQQDIDQVRRRTRRYPGPSSHLAARARHLSVIT